MSEFNNHLRLTPVQEQTIAAITGGATMQAAAAAAGVHRNTISYWRRTSLAFREALAHAQYDKANFIREEAETQVADAFAAIHTLLTKPDASDSARLNAAKYIIAMASTPPLPQTDVIYRFQTVAPPVDSQTTAPAPDPAQSEIVNSFAQSAPPQPVRTGPKIGRNEPCPCGSGLKFKRCCLGKPPLTMAA